MGKIETMKRFLYFDIFIAGGTTIAIEFAASRSLQNVYGASNFVWATIIGLIMIYFALGYYFGGKVAEGNGTPIRLFSLQAIAGVLLFLIPFFSNVTLMRAALAFDQLNLPVMAGAFMSVIVIYSAPIILLAMTTPISIKILYTQNGEVGKIAGEVNAISTIGSVFGAFIPTLWLFGSIGTSRTIQVIALLMFATAMVGLLFTHKIKKWITIGLILFLIAAIFLIFRGQSIKQTSGQIFETESAYNYIEVVQSGNDTYLRLNEGQGFHSQYNSETFFYHGPWEVFLLGPMFENAEGFNTVDRITIVGMAAGTTIRQASIIYPNSEIIGIEIDGAIVEAGFKYFGLKPEMSTIVIGDGRYELSRLNQPQDLIIVDAYVPPYIPGHLVTREFFALCAKKLTLDGMVAINVGRTPTDRSLIDDLATTLRTSFDQLLIVDLPDTFNTIIFASNAPLSIGKFIETYATLDQNNPGDSLLAETGAWIFNQIRTDYGIGMVYTDDRNQIDLATNRMIIKFLLSE